MQLLNLSSFQIDKVQFKRFSSDFERRLSLIPLAISGLALHQSDWSLSPTARPPIQHDISAKMKADGRPTDYGTEHTEQTRVSDLAKLSDGRLSGWCVRAFTAS